VESFFSALHNFTALRVSRVDGHPIDAGVLSWLPVIGLIASLLAVSFYVPLAVLYFPIDVAIVPGLVAVSWLRGFKPESDFCQLCDLFFGYRRRLTRRPVLGVPGFACLALGILLKYAILRQFYLLETVRLLAFGTMVSYIAPLFRPAKEHRWLTALGLIWLLAAAAALLIVPKTSWHWDLLAQSRGPVLSIAAVYLSIRLTFSTCEQAPSPNVASFLAELTAYLSFLIVRYHFL
jgi:cobalamin synthase